MAKGSDWLHQAQSLQDANPSPGVRRSASKAGKSWIRKTFNAQTPPKGLRPRVITVYSDRSFPFISRRRRRCDSARRSA